MGGGRLAGAGRVKGWDIWCEVHTAKEDMEVASLTVCQGRPWRGSVSVKGGVFDMEGWVNLGTARVVYF